MKDLISGDPIRNFRGGWAFLFGLNNKPHYWVLDKELEPKTPHHAHATFYSLCGRRGYFTDRTPAVGTGNFPVCKNCQKKREKK